MSDGSFITGDLCPSRKPLDRDLLEVVKKIGPHTPVALVISGLWLMRHGADFQWLKEQERSGAPLLQPGAILLNSFVINGFSLQHMQHENAASMGG
jgi:hypothetical protein